MSNAKQRLKRKFRKPAPAPAPRPEPRMIERPSTDPAEWGPNAAAVKIMPPPIENLMARGLISIEQYNAACEIGRVFHWVTAGLKSRMSDLTRMGGGVSGNDDPLQSAYIARYRPWADTLSACRPAAPEPGQMSRVLRSVEPWALSRLTAAAAARKRPGRGRHHPKTLQFVIDFVIDDRTIETIAREEKHDHKTVKRALLDGLTLYAEIAGWLRRAA
jgi:hypothetical protein